MVSLADLNFPSGKMAESCVYILKQIKLQLKGAYSMMLYYQFKSDLHGVPSS